MTDPKASVWFNRRRGAPTAAAFIFGIPLGIGVLYAIDRGPLHHPALVRYVHHPVEIVEVMLFCIAIVLLAVKYLSSFGERRACRAEVLPPWDGRPAPAAEAANLLAGLAGLPRRLQKTFLVNRLGAVLDFVRGRNSAADLDDQVRALSDTDVLAVEGSYSLTRFITWATPILGFLGTVLGITQAISGVTPEQLEKDLSRVTDGLATAFDTTALALFLTMILMFVSFIVERAEQKVLELVDAFVDKHLSHRFERAGGDNGEFVAVVRQNTQNLLGSVEKLVERQAEVWARAVEHVDRQRAEAEAKQQQRLSAVLETALEKTLEAHSRRMSALEKQAVDQSAQLCERLAMLAKVVRDSGKEQENVFARLIQGLAARTEVLARLQDDEKHLVRLQETLQQNLAALAGGGAFEEAMHSLTAAIHLLTARTTDAKPILRKGPGAAA